ncbi:hypothetical protein DSM106972_069970 [Dulcicalothrix desertica PCC 7102]|uniref:Uncharacterized protein n=1 Tax=Dulcicalothrix desertica PCC 7102 TaxID=232991 RepID=A0A433V4L7_9CYAN|nr:hypothetical protein [Dulcicalothrix desertica]RUT00991.1 hypothetical protein DSM106972_069970 [Dulcicalothrix desertica PCC 7102]TWH39234.1 hypothetical protein CAL7102_08450 [Dulcicalothrix desertica PCC 7102]
MSNDSSQNRLLALEKELYKWKQVPQNKPVFPVTLQEAEGDALETIEENSDGINIDEEFEQQEPQKDSAPLDYRYMDEFIKIDNLSYSGLASVLSNNASQRFNGNIAQLETQEDELAPLPREQMFGFSSDTIKKSYSDLHQKVTTIKQPTPKPTLELPEIELPEPDLTEFSLVSDTTFSDSEASYSSLLKALQEARLNKFADSAESDETENKD